MPPPCAHSNDLESPPSQSHTVSLLETGHILSCDTVLCLSNKHLRDLWDSQRVPTKQGPGDLRSYTTTISAIDLAREYEIPGLLKRAFYELLSSEAYCAAYRTSRDSIKLSHEDKERLAYARAVLGGLWSDFILAVPDTDVSANV